jgi:hypothetical protein
VPNKSLFARRKSEPEIEFVIVVSGLPRSGTSMMMQILQAGGLEILTDQQRTADEDNPKGYYEFERVKKMKDGEVKWVKDARGKVVKVISALLEYLPRELPYKVIFMQRKMDEILASQKQMLVRRGEPTDKASDATLGDLFTRHLQKVETWLAGQPNIQVLYIQYDELLAQPDMHIHSLVEFLGLPLDAAAMLKVPDTALYRQRK